MQHTCARRPLAFALASLTTLTTISIFNVPRAAACEPPPTFSETLERADVIVVGSITETSKATIEFETEKVEVTFSTIHVAESIKGPFDRGSHVRIVGVDGMDFAQRINDDGAGNAEAPDAEAVPLSMRTGLFLAAKPDSYEPVVPSALSTRGFFDVTDASIRDSLVPLIRDFARLDAIEDPLKRRTELLEWIVRCAESPATRREGFYDFSQASSERQWRTMSEDASDREHAAAKVEFTDSQIDRLVAVWIAALEKREDGAMWFGNALGEFRGELVSSRLLEAIEAEGESGSSDVGTWMMTVASIYEWRSGHLLTQKLWESEDKVERAKIVALFLELAPIRGEIPEAFVAEESGDDFAESVEDTESEAVTEMEDVEREAVEAIERAAEPVEEIGGQPSPMDLVNLDKPVIVVTSAVERPEGLS